MADDPDDEPDVDLRNINKGARPGPVPPAGRPPSRWPIPLPSPAPAGAGPQSPGPGTPPGPSAPEAPRQGVAESPRPMAYRQPTPDNQPPARPRPVVVRPPAAAHEPSGDQARLAVWGATSSGKTTFLLALPRAAGQQGWVVDALDDDGSQDFLLRSKTEFVEQLLLPLPTDDETPISWILERRSERAGRPWRRATPGATISLRTVDRPGGDYRDAATAVVDQLLDADGILYLFDPDRELQSQESNQFFTTCLTQLRARARRVDQLEEGRLRHALAVCVTKFDSVPIFALAREGFWASQDDAWPYLPRVADEHAADFFEWMCRSRLGGSAGFVRDQILGNFMPERIRFFASSSIGFRANRELGFSLRSDFRNLRPQNSATNGVARDGMWEIPTPINVFEPVKALADQVMRSRR